MSVFPVFLISVQRWKRFHGAEYYVKAVINEDVLKSVCRSNCRRNDVHASCLSTKKACLDFFYVYVQIAFVSVAYNLWIFTAEIRFVSGVNEALSQTKDVKILNLVFYMTYCLWIYNEVSKKSNNMSK